MRKPIDENTPLEVGKYYWVPCAKIKEVSFSKMTSRHKYYPVLGPAHKDSQLGVSFMHYHYDGRFFNDDELTDGRTNHILSTNEEFQGIEIKRRKCFRLTTGICVPNDVWFKESFHGGPFKYKTWYESMIGKSCKGKRCPHLKSLKV